MKGGGKLIKALFSVPFKMACIALMVLIPLLGVWVSSSMAVFLNKPVWMAIVAGLAMFPVLPLTWDLFASWRRRRKGKHGPRILNLLDRMILRTVTLNAILIGALLASYPQTAFTALSTRGDWMLTGADGPRVTQVRRVMFQAADTLEWLYKHSKDNPYEKYDDDGSSSKPGPAPRDGDRTSGDGATPGKTDRGAGAKKADDGSGGTSAGDRTGEGDGDRARQDDGLSQEERAARAPWPQQTSPHPLVAAVPAEAEESVVRLAAFFKEKTAGPFDLARAIHDYVARRVTYDVPALRSDTFPPQDAATVLRTGKGVCAGYAKLFEALADAAGLEAVYVVGHARDPDGGVSGVGHAWNAIKIEDKWYLTDVTWDAGNVDGDTFAAKLRTTYYFTPPRVFVQDHFPDDPRWQLQKKPLTRGEFIRQPMMSPAFFANDLALVSPRRSQITVDDQATISIQNPKGKYLLVGHAPVGQEKPFSRCKVLRGPLTKITCDFQAAGAYDVKICVSKKQYGSYLCVGTMKVNAGGL